MGETTATRTTRADAVRRIAAMDDIVLRNVWITQTYRDLAVGLGALVSTTNNTWPSYGTWASKSVGSFIRMERLPTVLREVLDHDPRYGAKKLGRENDPDLPNPLAARLLDHTSIATDLEEMATHIANALGHGNCMVFAEIGLLMAAFLDAYEHGDRSRDALAEVVAVVDGDAEGVERLRGSATAYYEAMVASDPAVQAQWVLYGNLLAGWQEQIRLEPDLLLAVNAPLGGLERWLVSHAGWFGNDLDRDLDHIWDEIGTKRMMTLDIPGASLRLGRPVPLPPGATLDAITLPEVHAALEQLDPGGLGASAASDWTNLADRMRFIAALFCAHAHDPNLVTLDPFTAEQRAQLKRGEVPTGQL
jgi:hypothetical protein